MNHSEIPNIDELLNGFIDGELDQRHRTEVQRLLKHDRQIAERLQALQKYRRLVSSLPYVEAPPQVLENIKASLSHRQAGPEEKELLIQPTAGRRPSQKRKGARHLLLRRLTAAAAMIALVAVLAAVIYSIVAPYTATEKPMLAEQPGTLKSEPAVEVAAVTGLPEVVFSGRLELETSSPSEVMAFINKSIEHNIPTDKRTVAIPTELKKTHVLSCSRQNARLLLADLGNIWDKFDSAKLFVESGRPEGQIVVDAVAADQIIEIIDQDDSEMRIKAAKYFAALNNIEQDLPGKEIFAASDQKTPHLITIPKPVLTSSEKPVTKPVTAEEADKKVSLTIVVTGNE